MEGLNKVLTELANLLGVSKDALKGTLDTIGANYKDVYSILVREYAIKQVVDSVGLASFLGFMGFCALSIVYMINVEEFRVTRFMAVGLVSCGLVMVLTLFGPIFYPNINLIMGLLDN